MTPPVKNRPKVTTKKIIEFKAADGMEYYFIVHGEGKDATLFVGYENYEDDMAEFKVEEFLDAVVAMFPEQVAYQFESDE